MGSEDCLYINVYTPEIEPKHPLPVMVFIHGGGFVSGNGNDDVYGPDFLVKQGVILVTFNYRLEALGFLCLDTEEIPGNAGMKDQVAALRWVKSNIYCFGGDSKNITIFGVSAGGASISFHLVSPMSKGLFQKAIMQSGTGFSPWVMPYQPREMGLSLARKLGLQSEDDANLNKFFKTLPVTSLSPLLIMNIMSDTQKPGKMFGIVSEKRFGDNERFFYGDIHQALCNRIHSDVEIMIGYTQDEGLLTLAQLEPLSTVFDKINNFADYLAPKEVQLNCKLDDQIDAAKKVKKFYFGNQFPSEEKWENLKKMLDYTYINYGVIEWAKFYANQKRKTYLYKFACKSERNMLAKISGLKERLGDKDVVCHFDDIAYLFPEKIFNHKPLTDATIKLIDNVCKLWTNFAKFGNPTPDDSLDVQWIPYSVEQQEYLNIGNSLSMEEQPEKEDMDFWESLYKKYVPKHVFSGSS